MTPLYAESVQPSEGKAQSDIDMIFQSPLNAEFIEKMLPLVKGNPKEALVKIPADRGGIAMAQKWGSIYVTRSLFKQYVRHKSAIHAKAGALAREEVQKLNIKNESEAAVELKKQTAKSMPISLGQAMEEMKDPRERLLLFCMCRTSHGYEKGYGLMSWVPDEEVRAATLEEANRFRDARLKEANEDILAKASIGPEYLGVTGFSNLKYVLDTSKIRYGISGTVSYPERLRLPAFLVTEIEPSSHPGKSGFKPNDVIIGAQGRLFKDLQKISTKPFFDNFKAIDVVLGNAIEVAESKGRVVINIKRSAESGVSPLDVYRNGESMEVMLRMPKVGGFSNTMPLQCRKSEKYAEQLAGYLAEDLSKNFNNQYFPNISLLGLLSVGDPEYDKLVGRLVMQLIPATDTCEGTSCCTWTHTSAAIPLCEYYLRTKDSKVLPGIERLYKILAAGQFPYYGSGHKCRGGDYRGAGINITAAHTLLSFALMKKCGIEVDEKRLKQSLIFLKGATEYGELKYDGVSTYSNAGGKPLDFRYNGTRMGAASKGGCTAIAARLLGDDELADALVRGIRHELGEEKSRFSDFTTTHGLPMMGMFWGYLALGGADEDALSEAMRKHIWYLQMHRVPDEPYLYIYKRGGPRYVSTIWLLGFNARKHNLYITGKDWWKDGYKVPLADAGGR